jgi:hypothetical protein
MIPSRKPLTNLDLSTSSYHTFVAVFRSKEGARQNSSPNQRLSEGWQGPGRVVWPVFGPGIVTLGEDSSGGARRPSTPQRSAPAGGHECRKGEPAFGPPPSRYAIPAMPLAVPLRRVVGVFSLAPDWSSSVGQWLRPAVEETRCRLPKPR